MHLKKNLPDFGVRWVTLGSAAFIDPTVSNLLVMRRYVTQASRLSGSFMHLQRSHEAVMESCHLALMCLSQRVVDVRRDPGFC